MIDSIYTNQKFFDKNEFIDYKAYRAVITIADGTTVWTRGRGTIETEWLLPKGHGKIKSVNDVLHVPGLTCGLFPISQATRKGFGITFLGEDCNILKDNNQTFASHRPAAHSVPIRSVDAGPKHRSTDLSRRPRLPFQAVMRMDVRCWETADVVATLIVHGKIADA